MLQVTSKPEFPPHKCMVTGFGDGPLVDTGFDLPIPDEWGMRQRLYLDAATFREWAVELGMVRPEEHQKTLDALSEAAGRLERLSEELEDLRGQVEAIYALKAAGWQEGKKPGRKSG